MQHGELDLDIFVEQHTARLLVVIDLKRGEDTAATSKLFLKVPRGIFYFF